MARAASYIHKFSVNQNSRITILKDWVKQNPLATQRDLLWSSYAILIDADRHIHPIAVMYKKGPDKDKQVHLCGAPLEGLPPGKDDTLDACRCNSEGPDYI
jgi:hypothetical protein